MTSPNSQGYDDRRGGPPENDAVMAFATYRGGKGARGAIYIANVLTGARCVLFADGSVWVSYPGMGGRTAEAPVPVELPGGT